MQQTLRLASNHDNGCDYCLELQGSEQSTFHQFYGSEFSDRTVRSSPNFVVWPTFGQAMRGSLLVVPRFHVECAATLGPDLLDELVDLVDDLTQDVPYPLVYEHGAKAFTGGSCGIYHAHLHVTPSPRDVQPLEVFDGSYSSVDSLREALDGLAESDQYLVLASRTKTAYVDVSSTDHQYPSQFFRQRLTSLIAPGMEWDWRKYKQPEADVAELVVRVHSGGGHVFV